MGRVARPLIQYPIVVIALVALAGLAIAAAAALRAPDLRVSDLKATAAAARPGDTLSIQVTTTNIGAVSSPSATTTHLFLSHSPRRSEVDAILIAKEVIPPLGPGSASTTTLEASIPRSIAPGTYFVLACADDLQEVSERNERNNCQVSDSTVRVLAP